MNEFELIYLDVFRTRKVYSFLPIIISGGEFVWTGKWFEYVTIEEQKYKVRHLEFDDGWSYQSYWGKWSTDWEFVKIIK